VDVDAATIHSVGVGDVLALDPRQSVGFDVQRCLEVILRDVAVLACSNECFTSAYSSKLAILGGGIVLTNGRLLAANNGGHNHHSSRLGVWIDGGTWQNAGDDTCHVSGLVMSAIAVDGLSVTLHHSSPDVTAAAANGDMDLQVGDTLELYDFSSGTILATTKIVNVSTPSLDGSVVQLDKPLAHLITLGVIGSPFNASVTQFFNRDRGANQFVFRNNTVENGRRVGVLAKGVGGLIEDNVFRGLGGGGVELWNCPYEGLCAEDYTIRRNTIHDVCQLDRDAAPVWSMALSSSKSYCHHNLSITDNHIESGPGTEVLLTDVEGGLVQGNTVVRCASDPQGAIATVNAVDVEALHNTVLNVTSKELCAK